MSIEGLNQYERLPAPALDDDGNTADMKLKGLELSSTYLARVAPRAKTELGAVTLMGLTTGRVEMARLTGWASIETPRAIWSSTSLRRLIESRYSIILLFRLVHKSWVMQRPPSSPMQFSLPAQPVASMGSSTATMMSATVMSSARRPKE